MHDATTQGRATTTNYYQRTEPWRFPSDSSHVSLSATNPARTHGLPEIFLSAPSPGLSTPQGFQLRTRTRRLPRPARRAPAALVPTGASFGARGSRTRREPAGRGHGGRGGGRGRGMCGRGQEWDLVRGERKLRIVAERALRAARWGEWQQVMCRRLISLRTLGLGGRIWESFPPRGEKAFLFTNSFSSLMFIPGFTNISAFLISLFVLYGFLN